MSGLGALMLILIFFGFLVLNGDAGFTLGIVGGLLAIAAGFYFLGKNKS